jgi:peptidoglycan/xylan/chitin deacetylase (PgdA/CDA1 family)
MTCRHCQGVDRRSLLGLLGLGVAGVLAGCDIKPRAAAKAANYLLPPIPPPVPGPPEVFWQGPPAAVAARQVAITIDDGYCAECAQAYAALAEATGIHITFNPNGCYGDIWTPLAKTLKPLIEAGQVQIGNHTFNHWRLTNLTDVQITAQLEQNDAWIEQTYGITGRPWWRPPYGAHDERGGDHRLRGLHPVTLDELFGTSRSTGRST